MNTIGNIMWFVFGGIFWAISTFIGGIVCCITIIGIPVGIQLFKFAGFVLWPFGKHVTEHKVTGFKTVINILWAVLGGIWIALGFLFTGLIFCITIIGIPFGKQYFKMARFVITPLGYGFDK